MEGLHGPHPGSHQPPVVRPPDRYTGLGALASLAVACQQSPAPAATTAPAARPTDAPKPTEAAKPATAASPAAAASPGASPAASPAAQAAPAAAPAAAAKPATVASGTLTIAQGVDTESLDPYVTTSSASKGMLWTVFDRLVYRDLDLKIQPGLALSWQSVNDTTWELRLRQGVQFHNGEPFDANAVKFSFARYVDPAIKNGYATLLKPVSEVEVVDPSTVRIKTSSRSPS